VVLGFTDHDRDLVVGGVTYYAATGYTATAVSTALGVDVDSLEVQSLLDSAAITEADLQCGLYDGAEVLICAVNYLAPTAGLVILRRGWIGQMTTGRTGWRAEIRGMLEALSQEVGELYSPACRCRELGDARCQVNLAGHTVGGVDITVTGTVTDVTASRREFGDDGRIEVSGHFDAGKITWLTGENHGLTGDVKTYTAAGGLVTLGIELQLSMPYPIGLGDTYSMIAGCDRTRETCRTKFANVLNFRGEPDLPGRDRLVQIGPGA
jgi:uncharacterized phage protein (TIGR02218 family)